MKVRCIKSMNEQTGESVDDSSWLTTGKEYRVLSIHMQHGLPLKFQIIGDDEITPAYHVADQFEIVSNFIPSTWVVDFEPESYFKLSPKEWCKPGFWEDYFDGISEAVTLFHSENEKLIQEEP